MKKKNKLSTLSLSVAMACLPVAFIANSFQQEKDAILSAMALTLEETINKDFQQRIHHDYVYSSTSLQRKIKGIKVRIEGKTMNVVFKDSIDELMGNQQVDQYLIAKFNPVVPNKCNTLFKEGLEQKGITVKTGIIYRQNGIPKYSKNDSISPRSALRTHIKMLDIKNTTSVQGWAEYNWGIWFKQTGAPKVWIALACYIIAAGIVLLKTRTKKIENPVTTGSDADKNYRKAGKIKLDVERRILYLDGIEFPITRMDFDLLLMFVEKPDHFLTREEIRKAFWPKDESADDKINTHITLLRNKIKELEGYTIKTIRSQGYRLSIPHSDLDEKEGHYII